MINFLSQIIIFFLYFFLAFSLIYGKIFLENEDKQILISEITMESTIFDSVTNTTAADFLITPHVTKAANWTIFSCSWLDEIYNIQNGFYWRHNNSSYILTLYIIVCSFGALANLFVIIAFCRTTHLRNLRNYFIVNLAVSDLILCTVTAPFTLRLAAKAPIVCYLVVWLLSLVVAAPYFFAVDAEPVNLFDPWNTPEAEKLLKVCDRKRPQICIEKTWHRLPFTRRDYTLSVLAIQYILPLLSLAFAYSQIGSTIRRRIKCNTTVDIQRKQLVTKRNRKALLLLLMLVIIYAIAWLPINAYNVLNVLDVIEFSQYIFCHLIGMTSACINPLLYALINDSFRSAFFAMLRPLMGPCTKYAPVLGTDRHLFTTNRPPHLHQYGQTSMIVSSSSTLNNGNIVAVAHMSPKLSPRDAFDENNRLVIYIPCLNKHYSHLAEGKAMPTKRKRSIMFFQTHWISIKYATKKNVPLL